MFHDLAETLAARIEALARARPEAGALWRVEAALAEAVASVGLEGVRIGTGDLLPRVALNGDQPEDARGAELALALLGALKRPGEPFADPLRAVRRFERIAGAGGEVGGWSDAPEIGPAPRLPEAKAAGLLDGIRPGDPPILAGLRAAARYAVATSGASPVVERLLLAAVEGALRATGPAPAHGARRGGGPPPGLGGRLAADWVALPATALSQGRLRLWRPAEPRGMEELVGALGTSLGAELGRIGQARAWCERAGAAAQGRHGRSRLPDALGHLSMVPLTNARTLAGALGITERGALNLLAEIAGLGAVDSWG